MNERTLVMDQKQEHETQDECAVRAGQAQTMLVAVDSFDDGLAKGRLHPFDLQESSTFASLDQLMFAMDEALEKSALPQMGGELQREILSPNSGDLHRREEKTPRVRTYAQAKLTAKRGLLANFYVRILCRDHASMQGILEWHEVKTQVPFRSGLELLLLLRSALNRAEKRS